MSEALQQEIRHLRTLEGSERDARDRIFLPLADVHFRHGDLDAAEEMLREGLTRHPDLVAAHVLKARVHEAQGDLDEAEETWAAARRLDPDNAEALFALGRILVHRGEPMGGALVLRARSMDPTAGGQEPDADLVSIAELAPEEAAAEEAAAEEAAAEGAPVAAAPAKDDVVSIAALAPDAPAPAPAPASAPAPAPAPAPGRPHRDDRRVVTRTLAELLAGQGQRGRAIEMYEELVERAPRDPALRERLEELRAAGDGPGESDASRGSTDAADEAVEPEPEAAAEPMEVDAGDDPDHRDHLDHRIARQEPDPDTPTPFAWTEDAGADDRSGGDRDAHAARTDEETSGGETSISDYLAGLLTRTPRTPPGDGSGS